MKLDLKNMKFMQWSIAFLLIVQVVFSFNIMDSLRPLSYLSLGLCFLGFSVMLPIRCRSLHFSIFELLNVLYFLLLFVFTLLNGTDLKTVLYKFVEIALLLMLISQFSHAMRITIISFATAFSLAVYSNFLIMMMFPEWIMSFTGSEEDSFLLGGNYNQMGVRIICAITTNILCVPYSRWWLLNTVALSMIGLATLLLVGSMTATSSLLVFFILTIFAKGKIFRASVIAFAFFILFFQLAVVFSGEGLHNNELAVFIIEDVLGKDITFTNRTYLWDAAGRLFVESPIFGYGMPDVDWYYSHLSTLAIGPHNFIYNQMLMGGLILPIIIILMFIVAFRRCPVFSERNSQILTLSIVTIFFMMLMEVYSLFFVVYILSLIYFYPEISNSKSSLSE